MIRSAFDPQFRADIDNLGAHITDMTGDPEAALRRIREVDALVRQILLNPLSGYRLHGPLEGYLRRSGGRDNKISIIFEPCIEENYVLFLLASFGGQNWSTTAAARL